MAAARSAGRSDPGSRLQVVHREPRKCDPSVPSCGPGQSPQLVLRHGALTTEPVCRSTGDTRKASEHGLVPCPARLARTALALCKHREPSTPTQRHTTRTSRAGAVGAIGYFEPPHQHGKPHNKPRHQIPAQAQEATGEFLRNGRCPERVQTVQTHAQLTVLSHREPHPAVPSVAALVGERGAYPFGQSSAQRPLTPSGRHVHL